MNKMLSPKSKEEMKELRINLNLAGVNTSNSVAIKEHEFFALNTTVDGRKHVWFTATDLKYNVVAMIRQR